MIDIQHLSYSSITSFLGCAAWWKFKYLDKLPTLATPELAFGSAIHQTIETYLKTTQGALGSIWQEKWAEESKKENIFWDLSDKPEEFCNDGVRMLTHPAIVDGVQGIKALYSGEESQIEKKVELHVPGVPIPIIGYVDFTDKAGIPCDFKTSKASWNGEKAAGETQSLFYLAALNQMGSPTPEWKFRHYIFVKTKTPQFQVHEHQHNPTELFWLFGMIKNVWRSIEAEIYPENPTDWRCKPAGCEFWKNCRGKYGN